MLFYPRHWCFLIFAKKINVSLISLRSNLFHPSRSKLFPTLICFSNVYIIFPRTENKGVSAPVTGFEGPEKRLEVIFKPTTHRSPAQGLRLINKEQWQEMLTLAKCTILNHTKNECFDAFVLSESSLFVYPTKIMIKTCGTTTLLNCISKLMEFASNFELEVETLIYSR